MRGFSIILGALTVMLHAQDHPGLAFRPEIPRTWDDAAMADLELPLTRPAYSLRMISAETYYRIPVRPVYKCYPVYARDREPAGYLDRLRRTEPEIAFAATKLKSERDRSRYDILDVRIGTDPTLTMETRRGTGYYKVPSLKGVWYRGPFEHNGSVATLEDWFDPARLRDDYVPTGWKGFGVTTRAVKGHEFGLNLPPDDKKALIAFLKTL